MISLWIVFYGFGSEIRICIAINSFLEENLKNWNLKAAGEHVPTPSMNILKKY